MEKVSITLTSGNVLEKPLISAFQGTNGSYVVLDNEVNGAMGLPIILVSKFDGTKLEKITDTNEWNQVKEYLRNIISGNPLNYIQVPPNLMGDDVFFSQLTLPIASFESLKNNYNINSSDNSAAAPAQQTPVDATQPVQPAQPAEAPHEPAVALDNPAPAPAPAPSEAPTSEQIPAVDVGAPVSPAQSQPTPVIPGDVVPAAPVTPSEPVTPAAPASPSDAAPVVEPTPAVEPAVSDTPASLDASAPVSPAVEPTTVAPAAPAAPVTPSEAAPVVEPTPVQSEVVQNVETVNNNQNIDYTSEKEAFLKACENMFDALVAKFNK